MNSHPHRNDLTGMGDIELDVRKLEPLSIDWIKARVINGFEIASRMAAADVYKHQCIKSGHPETMPEPGGCTSETVRSDVSYGIPSEAEKSQFYEVLKWLSEIPDCHLRARVCVANYGTHYFNRNRRGGILLELNKQLSRMPEMEKLSRTGSRTVSKNTYLRERALGFNLIHDNLITPEES